MPAQITVLTEPLGADVSELRDCHLPPFMRSLKRWPLFKQNDLGAFDPEADADFVRTGRHACIAERAKAPVHFSLLDFG